MHSPRDDRAVDPGDTTAVIDETAETRIPLPSNEATGDTVTSAQSAAAGPLLVGSSFGQRYYIIRLLGIGGMGAVYQAWDQELGVSVALKVIRPRSTDADPESTRELEHRFKQELLLARQVTHKNVVRIFDLGEIDGIKYITMSYLPGINLAAILKHRGKLDIPTSMRTARDIVAGLVAAHEAGIVHRDLKPANIMVEGDRAVIMDFGIARSTGVAATPARPAPRTSLADVSTTETLTTAGSVVGTLEYMAPEQARGEAVDQRADIYALGLILYDMLLGRRCAGDTTAYDDLQKRLAMPPPGARTRDPAIPAPLDTIVTRCLQPDQAARFQTSAELNAALARLDDQGDTIPVPPRVSKRLVAASLAVVAALVTGTWWLTRTPPVPKPHDPVSVVIADLQNSTGDPAFDRTVEPILKMALETSAFISAYDRTQIRRGLGVRPPETLDEKGARELAVQQGLNVVLSGSVSPRRTGYALRLTATQAVTGAVVANFDANASDKKDVLGAATRLAARVRKSLGESSTDSAQRFAQETLSTTSLDVVREYATAMEAMSDSRFADARDHFAKTVAVDSGFGLGYAGMAMASQNLGKQQDAETYIKEAVRHVDRMTERERYRTRGLSYLITHDYQACAREYGDLIARYPADATAHNNLALCSTHLRNLPRALQEMRRVVDILPNRALYRVNIALYAAYAGDFTTGETESRKALELGSRLGLLPLAFAQLGQGQLAEVRDTYDKLAGVSASGASWAASGLGDLAVYEGRYAEAARILEQGAQADAAAHNPDRAAAKLVAAAYAQSLRGRRPLALVAAERALASSNAVKIRFLAGRVFVDAGEIARARALATGLMADLQPEPQAYGKLLDGDVALKNDDPREAIKAFTAANALVDTWLGHFDLGRAYLAASAYIQADSEFDRCVKRRGEALALFMDEEATYGHLPIVYYLQGRVREGLNSPGFADSYRTYLGIRGAADEDPLLPEIRRRAAQ